MNNTQTFGLQFIVRHKSKTTKMAGIYLRITVNRRKTELSTKLFCPIDLWDAKKEKVKSSPDFNFRHINRLIEENRAKVQSIYHDLRIQEQLITPEIIKNQFLGNKEESNTMLKLIDYHASTQVHLLSPNTQKLYRVTYKYIKAFLKNKKKTSDIYLSQIDYRFLMDYEAFLNTYQLLDSYKKLSQNTIMKHLSWLRALLNLAMKMEWISRNPFDTYKLRYKQTDRKFLSQDELDKIELKDFSIHRLEYTRDLFIFSCYTGLSYADIQSLTPDNIHIGIDGFNWLITKRKKTDTAVRIPLLEKAELLINKYKEHPKSIHKGSLFPGIANQRLNGYLKEIADFCDINAHLTFHMARHTFATTVTLTNGVPIETVSKILGHTKIATTQIYAKVLENKISADMNTLRDKLNSGTNDNKHSASV
ncbi:site-specific integrase [Carboxylicivirga sp. M1479]|uniref:site-specific integrase n=1 Tax=Carboxylicivirga sp. M1479 TaxID=2594476 RepID=UPI0011778054|nr:site-specific integrase [Carboxylicivirga sp. M1479]TRX72553.1 site-specific integrase [Carboxylicivirga sp. M1479]